MFPPDGMNQGEGGDDGTLEPGGGNGMEGVPISMGRFYRMTPEASMTQEMLRTYTMSVLRYEQISGLLNVAYAALDEMGWYFKNGLLYRPNDTVYEAGAGTDAEWINQQIFLPLNNSDE